MILVLLTFGDRLENHYQASLAIISYLKSDQIKKVCVVTDRPNFYQYFGEQVELITINEQIMNDWKGDHDFFWRIKMKGIEAATLNNPDQHILYVDSDTVYVDKIGELMIGLEAGSSYMHELEGKLSQLPSKTTKNMWKSLNGKSFAGLRIDSDAEMWNAGVIALPKSHAIETIQYAIELCDQMCATNCTRRLIEQFAFSIALKDKLGLAAAENVVAHYWGNKPNWNTKITEFFMYSKLNGLTFEQDLERFEPEEFIQIPTVLREKNTKHKLQRLLNKVMKPKEIRLFNR